MVLMTQPRNLSCATAGNCRDGQRFPPTTMTYRARPDKTGVNPSPGAGQSQRCAEHPKTTVVASHQDHARAGIWVDAVVPDYVLMSYH